MAEEYSTEAQEFASRMVTWMTNQRPTITQMETRLIEEASALERSGVSFEDTQESLRCAWQGGNEMFKKEPTKDTGTIHEDWKWAMWKICTERRFEHGVFKDDKTGNITRRITLPARLPLPLANCG